MNGAGLRDSAAEDRNPAAAAAATGVAIFKKVLRLGFIWSEGLGGSGKNWRDNVCRHNTCELLFQTLRFKREPVVIDPEQVEKPETTIGFFLVSWLPA
jgi:hypothetical protein